MSTVSEIEDAIVRLSSREAQELRDWLDQWLEDRQKMSPEFLTSIERGNADLRAGHVRKQICW